MMLFKTVHRNVLAMPHFPGATLVVHIGITAAVLTF